MLSSATWLEFEQHAQMYFLACLLPGILTSLKPTDSTLLASWQSRDMQALPFLWLHVSDDNCHVPEGCDSASAAWDKLKAHFNKLTLFLCMSVHQALHSMRPEPGESIDMYLHRLSTTVAVLTVIGVTVNDAEQLNLLLAGLEPTFHATCMDLCMLTDEPTLKLAKDTLHAACADVAPLPSYSGHATKEEAMAAHVHSGRHFVPHSQPAPCTGGHSAFVPAGASPVEPACTNSNGYTWCNRGGKGCHHCGHPGHTTYRCMHMMPQAVCEWIYASPNLPQLHSASAAHAAQPSDNQDDDMDLRAQLDSLCAVVDHFSLGPDLI